MKCSFIEHVNLIHESSKFDQQAGWMIGHCKPEASFWKIKQVKGLEENLPSTWARVRGEAVREKLIGLYTCPFRSMLSGIVSMVRYSRGKGFRDVRSYG
jgi:hypothetical protein